MNDELTRLHRDAWQRIPWLVNGTADAADRHAIEAHLRDCADCREEFDAQASLRAALADDGAARQDPAPAFARLLKRIDANPLPTLADAQLIDGHAAASPDARAGTRDRWMQALVAAVVVQAIGLVALVGFAVQKVPASTGDAAPRYQTLSRTSTTTSAATIRFVPSTGMSVGAMRQLLGSAGLRIVEVNADSTIYGLAPTTLSTARDPTATSALLRAEPGVLLAEPVLPAPADAR